MRDYQTEYVEIKIWKCIAQMWKFSKLLTLHLFSASLRMTINRQLEYRIMAFPNIEQ